MIGPKTKMSILFISSLAVLDCSSYPTLVGPKPLAPAALGETVHGSGCGMLIWNFIPAGTNSRTERAYRKALAGRGSGLTDTKIKYSWYVIPLIGSWVCTDVEGTVVR